MPELGIMSAKQAEAVAIQALGWIAMDDEITSGFLNNSGADVNDLAAAAKDPQFLGAVLDYVLMDDSLVIGFCDMPASHTRPPIAPGNPCPAET